MPFFNTIQSNSFVGFNKKRRAVGEPIISGKLFMWGDNWVGPLGTGDVIYRSSPVQVGALTTWSKLATGNHTLAVKSTGELWAWGFATYGGLGNSPIPRSSPIQVGALTNWATPETDQDNNSFCIKTDGTLWAWGRNLFGSLGLGDTTANRSSPVQIGSSTNWVAISAGSNFTLAVESTGKLFAWGKNAWGQLGQNNATYTSSPVQIGALTNWKTPFAAPYTSLCTKTDGTLWVWGNNGNGRLGLGDTTLARSSPIQVGALTNWATLSGSSGSSFCVKTNGELWSWGANGSGLLGQNNTTDFSSPVQVGALTNWKTPAGGGSHVLCSKTDGTLWAWGKNHQGQLGQGNKTYFSSPVQVGALLTWAGAPAAAFDISGCIQS